MRTYICTSCAGSIIVGHPTALFQGQATALAREAYPLLERILHGRGIRRKLQRAMVERFYLEPHRYRVLPSSCPRCGHRGGEAETWWSPGLVHA